MHQDIPYLGQLKTQQVSQNAIKNNQNFVATNFVEF